MNNDISQIRTCAPRPLTLALTVFLLTFLFYSPTVQYGFVWDDYACIKYNPNIRSLQAACHTFLHRAESPLTDIGIDPSQSITQKNYRPLRNVVHAVVWQIWGDAPMPYHVLNVFMHALVAFLLFWLIYGLAGRNSVAACLGACFFALHPVVTETVCWAKILEDILSAFFALGAVILWFHCRRRTDWPRVPLAVALFTTGLFAKISAVFVPVFLVAVLVLDVWQNRDRSIRFWSSAAARIRARAIQWCGAGAFAAAALFVLFLRQRALGRVSQGGFLTGDAWTTWLSMPRLLLRYLRLQIAPYDLMGDYIMFPRATSLLDYRSYVFTVAFLAVFSLITWALWKRKLLIGWLWFTTALLPFANIVPMLQLGAERFLYFATMGTAIVLAQAYAELPRKRSALILCTALLACFALISRNRMEHWSDNLSFWTAEVKQHPGNLRAKKNLAKAELDTGQPERALGLLKEVYQATSERDVLMLYGYASCLTGDVETGRSILIKTGAHMVLNDLGAMAAGRGEINRAVTYFTAAAKLAPHEPAYRQNLARALAEQASSRSNQ